MAISRRTFLERSHHPKWYRRATRRDPRADYELPRQRIARPADARFQSDQSQTDRP